LLILNPYEKMWWREVGGNGVVRKQKIENPLLMKVNENP
jgi:hypothetical protein